MKEIKNGVWPVMITPFTEDNKIDYTAVNGIIDWYAEHKVTGIFGVCQSSEMFFLTRQERYDLAAHVIEHGHARDMEVVVSGHVAKNIGDQIDEAKEIIALGPEGYVFISNQFAEENEDEETAKRRISFLTEKIGAGRYGVYECPYPYKRVLSPELLRWCAESGAFAFLKDTCCDLEMLKAKCDAVRGSSLKIFNANAATLLESLRYGVSGYSGVMANFHPDLYDWLVRNFNDPSLSEKVEQMQAFLGATSMIECQIYPVNAKYHMNLEGVRMSLITRSRRAEELLMGKTLMGVPSSKLLEVRQFRACEELFRKAFFA